MKHTALDWFAIQLGITNGTMLEKAKEIEKEEQIRLIKFSKEMCTADAPIEYIINEYNKYGR